MKQFLIFFKQNEGNSGSIKITPEAHIIIFDLMWVVHVEQKQHPVKDAADS
ncbi:MAG: hypothetical protein AAF316_16615 [Cyanobacteria bacterium P01_A01_bin.80]